MQNIFINRRLTKKERKEMKLREQERLKHKAELARLATAFKDKNMKKRMMKRVEKTPTFQKDFLKMKKTFINPDFFKMQSNVKVKKYDKLRWI